MKRINLLVLALIVFGLASCKKDPVVKGEFEDGIFVVNEGNFGQGNASLSFIPAGNNHAEINIFKNANNQALGDQAQSIALSGDNAYIVVTGSNKVEVADRYSMKKQATIGNGLQTPRYFEPINATTALVSCWGDTSDSTDDYLAIVNMNSNTVTGTIPVDLGPEKMLKSDDYLFVAHKGAWGTNNKVTVYDLVLNHIKQTITVGDRPNSMVVSGNFLWVLCSGEPSWTGAETAGQLYKIDMNNNFAVSQTFDFATTEHPNFLSIDGNNLFYFLNGKIYKMDTSANALPTSEFITYQGVYNMEANAGKLYISDAKNYTSEGEVVVFDAASGQEVARNTVGIIPGDIAFGLE